ncbi:MAG TPA: glycosyltransferase family 4 protein, partial [Bacteroidota bacterium]|nr:glycosyltransferase family 4 protein [Bacteroidota bacterium]
MRIALVGIALPPIIGGLEVHIWELAKHLALRGHDVHLFGTRTYRGNINPAFERCDGVSIHRVGGTLAFGNYEFYELCHATIASRILDLHAVEAFDLVHGHCVYPSGISCRVANLLHGLPYVITSHGDEIMAFGKNILYKRMRVWLTRNIFRHANRVIAVSNELRELSIGFGSPAERTIRMSNAIDPARFRPAEDRAALRRKLGLPVDGTIVLSLRRLSVKNGVQYLIDAAPVVIEKYPEAIFLLCGDGDFRRPLEERVALRGVGGNFRFLGSVPNESVTPYIQASDVAVFPSLAEATSIACLEVMACGVPVVASNVGGLPEIVRHGENGMLVEFGISSSVFQDPGLPPSVVRALGDAIVSVLADSVLRRRLGASAADYVRENHSWEVYTDSILKLYRE